MKKLYILLALAIGFSFGLKAQTIEFSNEGTVINDTVKFQISSDEFMRTDYIHFKNITSETKTILVQLHRVLLAPNSTLAMCFNGTCLVDTISTVPVVLEPNVEYTEFDLQYTYENNQTSIGKINILDASTKQVLQSFVAKYYDATVSLPKQVKPHFALSLDVYPNPVSNNATINYTLPSNYSNGQIVVRNMIGSTVKSTEIKSGVSGKYQFSTMELANGVYFYSIIGNGKTISTKKMVVKH